jgi:hypothetical protein
MLPNKPRGVPLPGEENQQTLDSEDDARTVAIRLLRNRVMSRQRGPYRGPIQYPDRGWM